MQKQQSKSKLRQLQILKQQQSNLKFPFSMFQGNFDGFQITKKGYYYPYNHQIRDRGWGCAWRAIQMFASYYDHQISFQTLFQDYATKQSLLKIIQEKKMYKPEIINELKNSKWSPQESANNWAEPFIGKIICQNLGIKTKLVYINQPCKNGYAPQSVFEQIVSFSDFWKILKNHFTNKGPIMIDDGLISLTIIGCKQSSQNDLHIILGDPHIGSNKQVKSTGIYEVILNKQGQCKEYIMSKQQIEATAPSTAYQMIAFNKSWMALIAQEQL